jgi:hypothetical protein
MDKAEADTALARLQRSERAHARNQNALHHAITQHEQDITALTTLIGDIDTAIGRRQDTRGDKFTMTVDGYPYAKRAEAGQRLKDLLQQELASLDGLRQNTTRSGHLGGFPLAADINRALGNTTITLALDGAPRASIRLTPRELGEADPAGLITRLENRLARLEEHKAATLADIRRAQREIEHARDSIGKPFPQAAQLAEARERARQIDEQLQQMTTPQQDADQAAPSGPEHPAGLHPGRGGVMATCSVTEAIVNTAASPSAGRPAPDTTPEPQHHATRETTAAQDGRWIPPSTRSLQQGRPARHANSVRQAQSPERRQPDADAVTTKGRATLSDSTRIGQPAPDPASAGPRQSREEPVPHPVRDTVDWRDAILENERQAWQPRPIQPQNIFPGQPRSGEPEIEG